MKTITVTEFKAKCLAVLSEVERTGDIVVVTKHGRPVAQVSPTVSEGPSYPQHALFGTVVTVGDIVAPAVDGEGWDAERGDLV